MDIEQLSTNPWLWVHKPQEKQNRIRTFWHNACSLFGIKNDFRANPIIITNLGINWLLFMEIRGSGSSIMMNWRINFTGFLFLKINTSNTKLTLSSKTEWNNGREGRGRKRKKYFEDLKVLQSVRMVGVTLAKNQRMRFSSVRDDITILVITEHGHSRPYTKHKDKQKKELPRPPVILQDTHTCGHITFSCQLLETVLFSNPNWMNTLNAYPKAGWKSADGRFCWQKVLMSVCEVQTSLIILTLAPYLYVVRRLLLSLSFRMGLQY